MKGLRIFQYGCGKMSVYTMKYVIDNGGTIVGAVDINPAVIGKDIGEIMGINNTSVIVEDAKNAEKLLTELKPDCVNFSNMIILTHKG